METPRSNMTLLTTARPPRGRLSSPHRFQPGCKTCIAPCARLSMTGVSAPSDAVLLWATQSCCGPRLPGDCTLPCCMSRLACDVLSPLWIRTAWLVQFAPLPVALAEERTVPAIFKLLAKTLHQYYMIWANARWFAHSPPWLAAMPSCHLCCLAAINGKY